MKISLGKQCAFASVLFLTVAISGCGSTGDGSGTSMMPDNGGNGGNGGNGDNGDGPGDMGGNGDNGDGPGPMGGGRGNGGDGPGPMGGSFSEAVGGPGPMGDVSIASVGDSGVSPSAAAAAAASTAEPNFGSVTQSTNTDSSGVTTDTASVTFSVDPQGVPRMAVDVSRVNQSDLRIESAGGGGDNGLSTYPYDGRNYSFGVPLNYSNSELTLAYVEADWSSSDPTDYVSMGAWLNATGDFAAGELTSASMGVFVDGPELRGTPTLPVTGIATYEGPTEGMYAAQYGTDIPSVPEGSVELGFFSGDITLAADFGAETISGMVDDISLVGLYVEPDGYREDIDEDSLYELSLGSTSIYSNGTFTGTDITLTHPGLSIDSEGSWGGRFSDIPDSDGNPRLVGGTFGGTASTAGGSESSFLGAYWGSTDPSQ